MVDLWMENLWVLDTGQSSHLEFYIDYERMGRDMDMSGDIFTVETAFDEVHVFYNH